MYIAVIALFRGGKTALVFHIIIQLLNLSGPPPVRLLYKVSVLPLYSKIVRMQSYDTVSEAVNGLKKRGFELDFNLRENCLVCQGNTFAAHEFSIVEVYRFEGNSDPSDEAIVYAIESQNGLKGVLVNGYGISSEAMSAEIAEKLSIRHA